MSNLTQKVGTPLARGKKQDDTASFWEEVVKLTGQKIAAWFAEKYPPKPGAIKFFGQKAKEQGQNGHFFDVDPALAQRALDENHRQRQRQAAAINRMFRGEK